jgi:hypothetical protein
LCSRARPSTRSCRHLLTSENEHLALVGAHVRPAPGPTPRTRCVGRAGRTPGSRLNTHLPRPWWQGLLGTIIGHHPERAPD